MKKGNFLRKLFFLKVWNLGIEPKLHIVTNENMTWDGWELEDGKENIKRQNKFKKEHFQSGLTYLWDTEGAVPMAHDTYVSHENGNYFNILYFIFY